MFTDRQTHTPTDRHANHNTPLPYRGGVITELKWLMPFLLPHNTRNDHKQNTYQSGQRVVSESNVFVLRLLKSQSFWNSLYTMKRITKSHTVTHNNRNSSVCSISNEKQFIMPLKWANSLMFEGKQLYTTLFQHKCGSKKNTKKQNLTKQLYNVGPKNEYMY